MLYYPKIISDYGWAFLLAPKVYLSFSKILELILIHLQFYCNSLFSFSFINSYSKPLLVERRFNRDALDIYPIHRSNGHIHFNFYMLLNNTLPILLSPNMNIIVPS